ncbi:hypothetical protein E0W68_05125 [Flavobacterium salilacus subsp. salilacus]|uniref:hypothetical protein n=1 Tax=Flavobacterium TaxID=237 RepID=UPI0010756ABB|nr:hypothetical protein [Flavobacterium salilacus]KAF2519155.1 hypothetical protein E0W68_05125 [Flavobacterium salilacus subsp. salilacus]MBE1613334.1 hypothetical protein [Flavobacterium sp. SaA2.13]
MKQPLLLVVLSFCLFSQYSIAQDKAINVEKYTAHNKHKFFISWGGNRESYSKSDINFKGDNYNFTLNNVKAHDKPKGWHMDYLNPLRMTIPQTNMKLGFFITDHYSISLGIDHMKYVMTQNQIAEINGYINLPESEEGSAYNRTYNNEPIELTEDFLTFEHTDGLNYINAEFARVDDVSKYLYITNTDLIQINITEGIGGGVLYPKTNAKVLGMRRHDDFHVSGYGVSAKAGLNITFLKHFFIQGELKGGYIDMHDIRTTYSRSDSASQHFAFFERSIAIGGIFRI